MSCNSSKQKYSGNAVVVENKLVAEDTFHLSMKIEKQSGGLTLPSHNEIQFYNGIQFPDVKAGQFVMLRLPNRRDPLLGRPLAIYRCKNDDAGVQLEVVYLSAGKGTKLLSEIETGETLELTGPLGNGFHIVSDVHYILAAGGIGQTPFLQIAESKTLPKENFTLLYGAKNKNRFALVEDFEKTGIEILLATDDGSAGHLGTAVDLIRQVVRPNSRLLCCGPRPMLRAAFEVAKELQIPCAVSLESPMACGLGICFGCVVPVKEADGTIDYQRTCETGPAFDAYSLIWD